MDRIRAFLGPFGLPPDFVAWGALALGVVILLSATFEGTLVALLEPQPRGRGRLRFVLASSFVAAFLSLGYVAFYLRGGPRIIDATSYFLEGRTLAQGGFTFDIPDPSASFRGRFLLFSAPHQLGGIFPPGYPLLLAFGFVIGAPMVVGPLLAAAIVVATYFLARELATTAAGPSGELLREREIERSARGAVMLSVLCAALRYHTADTMAHGAAALALAMATTALLRAWREDARSTNLIEARGAYSLLGLAVGALIATRPVSAMPVAAMAILAISRQKSRAPRHFLRFALFAAPGVFLLAAYQHALTGSWLGSTQKAYYAVSDGPPGCFRYGFGAGVGCVYEHGDFVKARLEGGYGLLAALGTTLRRIRLHLLDVTNFELVTLAVSVPAVAFIRKSSAAKLIAILVVGQIVVYAPFYFDGSYPGGGARFYADVLPLEHALIAVALATQFRHFPRALGLAAGAGAILFAFHAAHDHAALAQRDGGRPMFEPDQIRESHKDHGLLFFDTDHGFNLALQPGVTASHGIQAVRKRGDDHDRYLYEVLGHPSTHQYVFGPDKSLLEPWIPPSSGVNVYRLESEGDWPPLAQKGGWAAPEWANNVASNDRYLGITPTAAEGAEVEIELLVPTSGKYSLDPNVMLLGHGASGTVTVMSRGAPVAGWDFSDPLVVNAKPRVSSLPSKTAELVAPARIVVRASGGASGIDRIIIRKIP